MHKPGLAQRFATHVRSINGCDPAIAKWHSPAGNALAPSKVAVSRPPRAKGSEPWGLVVLVVRP